LFMNSVSRGKIWIKNAASLWKGSIFLKRACLVVSVQEPTLPPPPPVPSTLFFQLPIKGHKLCLRGRQLGGGGGGGGSHQKGQDTVLWSHGPLPHPSQWFRYTLVLGQRGCFRVLSHVLETQVSMSAF
jgi:hypothetical protein